jgi:hypothetical protein
MRCSRTALRKGSYYFELVDPMAERAGNHCRKPMVIVSDNVLLSQPIQRRAAMSLKSIYGPFFSV